MSLPAIPQTGDRHTWALPSTVINDASLVVHGPWSTKDRPRPRFGNLIWDMTGLNPIPRKPQVLNFTTLPSAEWALYAREMVFLRLNQRRFRHVYPAEHNQATRSGTFISLLWRLKTIAEHAEELGIGLPHEWLISDTDRLSERVQADNHERQFGTVVRWLHDMRRGLTLGGIGFDPTAEVGVAAWAGDTASRPLVSGSAMTPAVFHAIVANALFYLETAAPDILTGLQWFEARKTIPSSWKGQGETLSASDPIRGERDDVRTPYVKRVHEVIEALGAIPRRTATNFRANSKQKVGDISVPTLNVFMNRDPSDRPPRSNRDPVWTYLQHRTVEGLPNVDGGLPIQITEGPRPDGSIGPWRIGFCPDGLLLEATTLREACWTIILAFTGMRAGEAELLPGTGWLTSWYGADALTTNLIKGAHGELLKWWASPPVIQACHILDQLNTSGAAYLDESVYRRGSRPTSRDRIGARVYYDVQNFVQHIETDTAIRGFIPIEAGWKTTRGYSARLTEEESTRANRPNINPHQFRFTLASLASVVGFGDVAFQKQAKHAAMNVTHAYMTNRTSPEWLNVLVNAEAVERANRALDFFVDTWTGIEELKGPGGRQAQRVIRELLADLPLDPYNPDSLEPAVEQFATQVRTTPELLSALRATATTIHLGDVVHCWENPIKQECADLSALPILGLCRPETCQNAVIDRNQESLWRLRISQVEGYLTMKDLAPQQRIVLEARRKRLKRQLEGDGSGT